MQGALGSSIAVADALNAAPRLLLRAFQTLVREGDPGAELYLVRSGCLLASIVTASGSHVIDAYEPGDLLGNADDPPPWIHDATVMAARTSVVTVLSETCLTAMVNEHPFLRHAMRLHRDEHRRTRIQNLSAAMQV